MSTLTQIRRALATTISDGVASEVFDYAHVADVQQLPAVVIIPEEADFSGAFQRGLDEWKIDVYVLVPRTETVNAQEELDEYITGSGPESIRQVIYNNPTLGLADTDAYVLGVKGYGGEFQSARVPHIGAVLKVCVRTDGAS